MKSIIGCIGIVLVSASPVLAQPPIDREMLKQHCTGDYLTHCGEFAPGGPEVEACFRRKIRQLSPNCSAAIAIHQQGQGRVRRVEATPR